MVYKCIGKVWKEKLGTASRVHLCLGSEKERLIPEELLSFYFTNYTVPIF